MTVRQNHYSLPVSLAGLRVAARIGAPEIALLHDGREVARHPHLDGCFQTEARGSMLQGMSSLVPATARLSPIKGAGTVR